MKTRITDTDRIDWLASRNDPMLYRDYEEGLWGIAEYQGNVNDRQFVWLVDEAHETLRDAIDKGIKKFPSKH